MKNSVKLVGIICKQVFVTPERTDFLLLVNHKGEESYIPCYTEGGNPYNLKLLDAVKVKGCIKSRKLATSSLAGKIVMEMFANKVTILDDHDEV